MISIKHCHTCHGVKKEGIGFGTALSEIGDKLPKEFIYDAIIDPDAGISFGFEGYMLGMKDGNTAVGLLPVKQQVKSRSRCPAEI
jgi:putative heme-binding domain-containing protein